MNVTKAIALSAAALATGAAILAYGTRAPASQLFGPSIYRGPLASRKRRAIALTFDDGPSPGTAALLDYLAAEQVKATFFQCGTNVLRHPDLARRVAEEGHEIGNHTYSHPQLSPRIGWNLNLRSPAEIFDELSRTQAILEEAAGVIPVLFRAPYGLRWIGLRAAQRRLNLLGVMWTVIGHDWEWPADRIAPYVLERCSPGGIICLHDGRDIQANPDISETLAAMRSIVPTLKSLGYTFETVSQLAK